MEITEKRVFENQMDFDSETQRMIDDFVWAKRKMKEPDDNRLTPARCHLARIKKKWWKMRWAYYPEDYPARKILSEYIEELDRCRKNGQGLLLYGDTGRGKTAAAMLIAKEIIRRDGFPLVVDAYEIPKIEIEDPELSHKMHATSFLIIDDLGSGAGKDASRNMVEQLIRDRDARELPMIITTNLAMEDTKETLGEACTRVINERCWKVKFG